MKSTVGIRAALLLALGAFLAGIVVGAGDHESVTPASTTTSIPTPTPVPLVGPLSR
ncbi:hypothetical protein [Goodfellowiella coeruleoviolacea]|uniref:Uncharacterized protein n=1 Tax=Goodfellowiella coeruleoviolacea TaxID=334858 RepID=A0AAE3KKT2_9PSEU|nr:hypothetical protein [Goodfellowiella coeruleoviolacea]MCP2169699.1 hypothetical protein [Goodfellowiella coeruleoviolacea]